LTYAAAGGEVQIETFAGEGHMFMTKRPDSPATVDALSAMIGLFAMRQAAETKPARTALARGLRRCNYLDA
jgi:hypothetical protein